MERSELPTRVIRLKPGEPWPEEDGFPGSLTAEEGMDLVWTLTKQAYSIAGEPIGESRLQRDAVRVERRGR